MALTEAQKKANLKYREKSIKRIPLDVQKEKYEEIKAAANAAGEKVNGYIKKAIDAYPEFSSSFVITFHLSEDITYNNDIFSELEDVLMANSEYMSGFTREGSSLGEFKLVLHFKKRGDAIQKITQEFASILVKHKIVFKYSDITVVPDSE